MRRGIFLIMTLLFVAVGSVSAANPVEELVARIDKSAVKKFIFELSDTESEEDFFELSSKGSKILVEGNNWISVAVGLNWYLRNYVGVLITHSNPTPTLEKLPKVVGSERRSTDLLLRYYLDVQTASSSTPYWDMARWQREIDFMALHGVNMPLLTTGVSEVWRRTLAEVGYSQKEIQGFLPHPAYESWWMDGLIEGWGGVVPSTFSQSRAELGAWVVDECEKWGMEVVLMGYNGTVPSDSTSDERWNGIKSPKVLSPESEEYQKVADVYYSELEKIYGTAKYYMVTPPQGSATTREEGEAIYNTLQSARRGAVWVVAAWDKYPSVELIDYLPRSGVVVIDKWADVNPQWGDRSSKWLRREGFLGHSWIYGIKNNFGGDASMYGNINRMVQGYYLIQESGASLSMVGIGATSDGVNGNGIVYELLYDLPWSEGQINLTEWVAKYAKARWGTISKELMEAWQIVVNTIYSPKYNSVQRGATQSVFAARPALQVPRVSKEGTTEIYYDKEELIRALNIMMLEGYTASNKKNFNADLVQVAMAVLSNCGEEILGEIKDAFNVGDTEKFKTLSDNFLYSMLLADNLLNSHSETMVGNYIEEAMRAGTTPWERDWLRYGARTLITSWGSEIVATEYEMHDNNYKLYGGLLSDVYAKRWARFFNYIDENESLPDGADYYDIEDGWATDKNAYPTTPAYDTELVVREILDFIEDNLF